MSAAERLIQEICNTVRIMIGDYRLTHEIWSEAIFHTNWIQKFLPSIEICMKIQLTAWCGVNPNLKTVIRSFRQDFSFRTAHRKEEKKLLIRSYYGHLVGMEYL